jgi:cation diffusion facilitator family transporter
MNLKRFLVVSLAANVLFAIFKILTAILTASSAMVSEGVHSIIDVINQVLLIWGIKISSKSPDFSRPFGYSKEFYFWSSILSLIIFIIGGCAAFYIGVSHFNQPYLGVHQSWSYGVLLAALVFNLIAVISVLKKISDKSDEVSILAAAELSNDPSVFVVLASATGDLVGIVVVLLGMYLGSLYHSAYYDSAASMLIGVVLFTLSFLLIRQCKRLLMTEVISPTMLRKILHLARTDDAVVDVKKHFTMYVAPKEALLVLETVFKNDLDSNQVNDSIERISQTIKSRFPRVKMVYIDEAAA